MAGATEHAPKDAGTAVRIGKFPFLTSGRARAMGETDGFVKVICDARSNAVLSVHCIGPNASELIAEAVGAMEFSASAEDLARIVRAHPTLSEAVHEAALGAHCRMIHL